MSRAQGWVAVAVVVVLVAAVALVLRSRPRTPDPVPVDEPAGPLRAVFVGDSITQADSPSYDARPGPGSWVRYVLADDRSPWAFGANVAVAGQTMGELAARFRHDVLAREPDAVVIMGGTNDLLRGLSVDAAMASLAAMVRQARDAGAKVWVVGPPPVDGLYQRPVDPMAAAQAAVATATGATYVGLGDSLVGPDGNWLPGLTYDGVHPTPEGARALGAAVLEGLT